MVIVYFACASTNITTDNNYYCITIPTVDFYCVVVVNRAADVDDEREREREREKFED